MYYNQEADPVLGICGAHGEHEIINTINTINNAINTINTITNTINSINSIFNTITTTTTTTTARVRDVRKTGGGRGLREGVEKRVNGVFVSWTTSLKSFRYHQQRRPVDDCSPGRGGIWHKAAEKGAERFMAKWIELQRKLGLDYGIQE